MIASGGRIERDLEMLADAHLAARARERAMLGRQPDLLSRYFKIYRARARRDFLRRLFYRADKAAHSIAAENPLPERVATLLVFWPTARRILRAASFTLIAVFSGFFAWGWWTSGDHLKAAERNLGCGDAVALVSETGVSVGHLPVRPCDGERPHLTSPVDNPQVVIDLADKIAFIEGDYRTSNTFYGQDLKGLARKIASKLGFLSGHRGVSAPLQSAFESLAGRPHGAGPLEKLSLVIAGMRFIDRHLPDDASRARFLVNRMPILTGTGFPLAGSLGMREVFGGVPTSLLDQCRFARQAGFPLHAGSDRAPSLRMSRRWVNIIGPATANCIRHFATSEHERETALTKLRALCAGQETCYRPPSSYSRAELDRHALEVARLTLPKLAPPRRIGAGGGLVVRDHLRLSGRDTIGIDLTTHLDPGLQAGMASIVRANLRSIERRSDLLPADSCLTGTCANKLDHLIAVAELTGDRLVLRGVSTNRHGALFGMPAIRTDGHWQASQPKFGQASLNKIKHALIAARFGVEMLCETRLTLTHDPLTGCDAGRVRASPTRVALARSLNDPFIGLARRYAGEMTALERAAGYVGASLDNPAVEATIGLGPSAPPARYMELLGAIMNGGRVGRLALFSKDDQPWFDLVSLGYSDVVAARAMDLLSAPISPGGTLASMVGVIAVPGCAITAGKSGTHATREGPTLSKVVLLAVTCGGRRFVVYGAISAGSHHAGIGAVKHRHLGPLLRSALAPVSSIESPRPVPRRLALSKPKPKGQRP